MAIADYNSDADLNTSISGIDISEGCAPSGINNAIRQMMADIAAHDSDLVHRTGAETVNGAKTFSSKVSVANNIYNTADDGATIVSGGTGNDSARLRFNGKNSAVNPGRFSLTADDSSSNSALVGDPSGSLLWANKAVERVHASSLAATSGYIRYTSGLQIVWGQQTDVSAQATVTYAQAFAHTPIVLLTPNANAVSWVTGLGTTSFKINLSAYNSTTAVRWIAIGDWA